MDGEKMEAGRELDALVAEKVMGWELRCDYCGEPEYLHIPVEPSPIQCWSSVPHFSTDIAAAWEVVEKFKANKCGMWCELVTDGRYHVYFFRDADVTKYPEELRSEAPGVEIIGGEDVAPTAPLAICRAALKAVADNEGRKV